VSLHYLGKDKKLKFTSNYGGKPTGGRGPNREQAGKTAVEQNDTVKHYTFTAF